MPIQDETDRMMKVFVDSTKLVVSSWSRTFVITPKQTENGSMTKPFSFAYTRTREVYSNGQKLEFIDWMTPNDYILSILKGEIEHGSAE